ncbi:MAG: VWA domain-containing protein [Armatimonadetes bacterium]|nr:VWA domain-containing protein [Armatimonadota bacterium]
MDYLTLANPSALWLLAALPVLAWLMWRAARKRREAVEAFASPALADRLVVGRLRDGATVRSALLLAALALLALAAARPRLGMKLERLQRKGADILVAIDTSDSMLAQDATPSRLEAAKREILGLIARLQGDRIGIITFSTQAFLYCPLTIDYDAATMFVESIDASITSGAGTALSAAVREADRAFSAGEGGDKVVVLVSDGEDWGQGAREAAQTLRNKGIRLYAVGVGTEEGAPVPTYDGQRKVTGTRRYEGKVVVSRLHAKELAELATAGGGTYFQGGTADHGAAAVYSRLGALQSGRAGQYTFRTYAERFQWPLGLAVLLLAGEFLMRVRPRRWPKVNFRPGGLAVLVFLCFFLTSGFSLFETPSLLCKAANRLFTEGKFGDALQRYMRALDLDPDNPVLRFNSGDALYRQQQFDKAREAFAKAGAASELGLAGRAHYNIGNSYLQEKKLDEAIEEYRNALRCDPGDALAKRNLEIAQKMKQQQQKQQPQQQQSQQQPQPKSSQQQQQQRPQERKQPAQSVPMTPEEARALLRQANYEDAQLRRQLARVVPPAPEMMGKDW